MKLLIRMLVCAGALLLAFIVTGHIFMIGTYAPDWSLMLAYSVPHGSLAAVIGGVFVYFNSIAIVLFVLVIALAESFGLRSLVFYVACGLALTVFVQYDFYGRFWPDKQTGLFEGSGRLLLAMGVTIGLVYWAVAGRNAGKWRQGQS